MVVEVLGEMCSLGGHQELGEEVEPEDLILLGNQADTIELNFLLQKNFNFKLNKSYRSLGYEKTLRFYL